MSAIYRLTLPRVFYEDHRDRDLPSGRVIRATGRKVEIECDVETAREILSDAEFYAGDLPYLDKSYIGLVSSARATAKIIRSVLASAEATS